ncbi:ATP-binding protein [Trinickia caryophylli]|uniref:sensor histidine kinase n=1 Tax=Trinickia caryophylli TaxID=28094 RepID=UPI001E46833E|nr:ATP-binding protein [Trinickia caryophylli]WQE14164.1 ATP-binding protein [Trinickia caryophylli]
MALFSFDSPTHWTSNGRKATTMDDVASKVERQDGTAHECRYRDRCTVPCPRLEMDLADPSGLSDLDCIRSFRRRDAVVYLALTAVVAILAFVGAFRYFFTRALDELDASAARAMSLYAQRLEREIDRFGMLPLATSMNRDVVDYLRGDRSIERSDKLTSMLRSLTDSAGVLQTYVIDATNHVVASSNRGQPGSFIGRDLSYRPYVQHAKAGHVEGYYAVGTTGNTAGYYLATAVEQDGRRLGTVATKIGLDGLEQRWLGGLERRVVVVDENDVIVLSSRADWKYHVAGTLSEAQRRHLYDTQQYNRAELRPLVWQDASSPIAAKPFVRAGLPGGEHDYLVVSAMLPSLSMRLMVLADPSDARRLAAAEAGFVAVLIALIALAMHIVYEKRLTAQEQQLAREALRRAYEQLKAQFERRSAQLHVANEGLRREVAERIESERRLRSYQEELIRTENLAVIGQLSAGLAHEINQPLAAMATLSENAVRFLQRGDTETARFNLGRIVELVTRMSTLTGRLRSFARRADGDVALLPVSTSIDNAVALLSHRIKQQHVCVDIVPPLEPLYARGEAVRLEQVLVNLLSNAIEAMDSNPSPHIEIRSYRDVEHAVVEVSDNGIGLSDEVLAKLFEPFFTTKKASGLGLGLAISADIVSGFGGSLAATNRAEGGACFRLVLDARPREEECR